MLAFVLTHQIDFLRAGVFERGGKNAIDGPSCRLAETDV